MVEHTIWISWENQRRNRELSAAFKIPLYEFVEIDRINNYLKKYLIGFTKTFCVLRKTRPRIVICQNPSIVLSFSILIFKKFIDLRVVVDAHNAGIFPLDGRSKTLNYVSRFIQLHADLTIVTNENMTQHVMKNGGRAFVLQDKFPKFKFNEIKRLRGKFNILFICSFADDEPYEIVFEAARVIEKDIFIYVTGNFSQKGINQNDIPENVVLTGYIPEREYVSMVFSVDATIDLTNRENCLVCGAYESVAAGKPMILSKTQALIEYFNKGAVYVEHTSDSIANGIKEVILRKEELTEQIVNLKMARESEWHIKKIELVEILRSFS